MNAESESFERIFNFRAIRKSLFGISFVVLHPIAVLLELFACM